MKLQSLIKSATILAGVPLILLLTWFLLTEHLRTQPQPEDYLPADTVALIFWKDFATTFSDFNNSPLGVRLMGESFERTLEVFDFPTVPGQSVTRVLREISIIGNHPLFTSLLHNHSYFALFPAEYQPESIEEYMTANGLLLVGLKVPGQQQKVIRQFIQAKLKSEDYLYQGKMISKVSLPGGVILYYAIMEQTLMVGLNQRPLERCIDTMNNRLIRPDSDLLHSPGFSKIIEQADVDHVFFGYINQSQLLSELEGLAPPSLIQAWTDKYGYFSIESTNHLDTKVITLSLYDPGKGLREFFNTYFNQQPAGSNHLDSLEQDVAVYAWTNWLDYEHLWNTLSISPSLETAAMLFIVGQKVYEFTGVDVNTFTAMFGTQAGIYIREVETEGKNRLPLLCLQFQLRDAEAMKELLAKLLSDIPTRKVVIGNHEGLAVMLAEGIIQPAFMVREDYLLIADSVEMLESYLLDPKQKLVDAKSYRKVKGSLKNPSNLVAYARIDKMNSALQTIIRLGLDSLQSTGNLTQLQRNQLDSTIIQPIFQSLANVRSQGIRVVNNGDSIRAETTLYIPSK